MKLLNIGQASKASGVSAKMIRHYESIGLIGAARRTDAGYRLYDDADIHTLQFIRNARDLGFPIAQIDTLLQLWGDRGRPSADVKRLAMDHIRELDEKINALQAMKNTLAELAERCHGDHRPDCPILAGLAAPSLAPGGTLDEEKDGAASSCCAVPSRHGQST